MRFCHISVLFKHGGIKKKLKIVSLFERNNWKSLIATIEFISLDIMNKKIITFVNFEPIRLLESKQQNPIAIISTVDCNLRIWMHLSVNVCFFASETSKRTFKKLFFYPTVSGVSYYMPYIFSVSHCLLRAWEVPTLMVQTMNESAIIIHTFF